MGARSPFGTNDRDEPDALVKSISAITTAWLQLIRRRIWCRPMPLEVSPRYDDKSLPLSRGAFYQHHVEFPQGSRQSETRCGAIEA